MVTNSTIANNLESNFSDPEIGGGGIVNSGGTLTITNSTIAYNKLALYGVAGGLAVFSGAATLDNTIVALNTSFPRPKEDAPKASDVAGHGRLGQAHTT